MGTFLEPDSYLIVWADKDLDEEGIHADFKLSKSGESIYLVHEDGTAIDSLSYGEQETNIASARIPNGTGDFVQQAATFADHNEFPNSTIAQSLNHKIQIFPNPANGAIFVDLSQIEQQNAQISINNYLGQKIKTIASTASDLIKIETAGFTAGFYLVNLIFEDGSQVSEKILVVRE